VWVRWPGPRGQRRVRLAGCFAGRWPGRLVRPLPGREPDRDAEPHPGGERAGSRERTAQTGSVFCHLDLRPLARGGPSGHP